MIFVPEVINVVRSQSGDDSMEQSGGIICSIQSGQGVLAIESQGAISKARTAGRRDFTHYRLTSVPYMNLYHVGYDCIWSSVNNWEHINSSAT